jgi:hypothetical protein
VVVPDAGWPDEVHPLLGAAATELPGVELALPEPDVEVEGTEVAVVDDMDELDAPHAVATTATVTVSTPHHRPRLLLLPGVTSI